METAVGVVFYKRKGFLIILAAFLAVLTAGAYLGVDLYYADGSFTFPLDDTYIYLHYARNAAAGYWCQYNAGDETTTGMTSYLYFLLLTLLAYVFPATAPLIGAVFALNVLIYGVCIYLFSRVVQDVLQGRYVILSTLVFATTGVVAFHALGGMDAGLLMLCLLGALRAYSLFLSRGKIVPLAASLAALTVARPEGIPAAALIAVAATAALFRPPQGRRFGSTLPFLALSLAPAPLYFLANYALARHVTSLSLLSKSPWSPGTFPWLDNVAENITYGFYVVKNVLCGFEGSFMRGVYNANIPQSSAAFFPPLTLAFFLVGWGRAARKSWAERRPSVAFVAGALFVMLTALSCWTLPYLRHYARYLAPFLPLFLLGVVSGIEGVATLIRYGRPAVSQRSMWWTGAAYFLVFGLMSSAYLCVTYGMSARDIRFQHIAVAEFIRENIPPDAAILAHDVGAIAYYSRHRILDVEGLTSREGWRYGPEGPGSSAEFVKRYCRPGDYAAIYLDIYPFHEMGILGKPVFEAELPGATMAGGEVLTLCPLADVAFNPGAPWRPASPPGSVLVDELDVADGLSEAAHDYRIRRRGGNRFPSFGAVAELAAQPGYYLFECGRNVSGVEEFTLKATPGRDMLLGVRCAPPYLARVSVDGVAVGRWEIERGGKSYRDGYILIPARVVKSPRVRIRLETLKGRDNYGVNKPTRYALFALPPAP